MNSHLSEEQISTWLSGERDEAAGHHLRDCAQCAAEVARIQTALALFQKSGVQIAEYWQAQPAPQPVRWRGRWVAIGVVFATAVLAVMILRHPFAPKAVSLPVPPPQPIQQVFMRIPYVVPPAPYERTEIVHMDVPVAALIAAGFRMDTSVAGDSVAADVLVGQDGRPLAVRFPENKYD